MKAGEKRVGGKGKKKSRSRAEDLGKGGVDGGLRFHLVVPFPVRYGTVITRSKDSLGIKIYIREARLIFLFLTLHVARYIDRFSLGIFHGMEGG